MPSSTIVQVTLGQDILVTGSDLRQTMDGFGGCDRNCVTFSDAQADFFFGTGAGQLGLSLMRTTMYPDGSGSAGFPTNLTKAAARGAKIWMTPWTAPASFKTNNDENNGGHLLASKYTAWTDIMTGFQLTCQSSAGIDLYAISVQGEPDFVAPYNSMIYTDAEMVAFLKVFYPVLAALVPVPRLIVPEPASASNLAGFITAIQADGTTAPYLDIVGWHQYDGNNTSPIASHPNWMTEMSYFTPFDATMTNALQMVADIHAAITIGNVTAWHYWELLGGNQADNENLVGYNGAPTQSTKRSYALGNFAKFIRPGYVRVGTTGTVSGVSLTAYQKASTKSSTIVATNTTASAIYLTIRVTGVTLALVTPYETSATRDLESLAPLPVTNGRFGAVLPALSVTTFAGTGV